MKRFAITLAVCVLATSSLGAATAQAATPANSASLTVAPAGTKKAEATWADWKVLQPTVVFDAYWVTADDDGSFTPFTADRGRFVDDAASRSVIFDDLNAGTTYYFAVYAIDYTNDGPVVVPPTGTAASTPIGYYAAAGSTLTINASRVVVPTGKPTTLYGILTDSNGAPIPGGSIKVTRDVYPYGDGAVSDTVQIADGGKWSQSYTPLINTRYAATYAPPTGIGGWTRVVTVEVRKKISIAVDPGTTVAGGTNVTFTGTLGGDPALLTGVQACLQRLAGSWGSLKCVDVDANGSYLLKFSPGTSADGKYRVYSGMGQAYADSWSRTKTLTVT